MCVCHFGHSESLLEQGLSATRSPLVQAQRGSADWSEPPGVHPSFSKAEDLWSLVSLWLSLIYLTVFSFSRWREKARDSQIWEMLLLQKKRKIGAVPQALEARAILESRRYHTLWSILCEILGNILYLATLIFLQGNVWMFTLSGCEDKVASYQFRLDFVTRWVLALNVPKKPPQTKTYP